MDQWLEQEKHLKAEALAKGLNYPNKKKDQLRRFKHAGNVFRELRSGMDGNEHVHHKVSPPEFMQYRAHSRLFDVNLPFLDLLQHPAKPAGHLAAPIANHSTLLVRLWGWLAFPGSNPSTLR